MQVGSHVIVARGMAHIASVPVVMSTTVGRELAVAVLTHAEPRRGGLINLSIPEPVALPDRLHRFLRDISLLGRDASVHAVIAGGGDPLKILPATERRQWLSQVAGLLGHAVTASGITIERQVLGGAATRLLTLDLCGGRVDVVPSGQGDELPGPRSKAALPPAPAPDPRDFNVDIGAARVDHSPNRLVAILGSCVGIALYDPATRIGGLVHAAMPTHPDGDSDPMRYTDTAVPALLAQMQSQGAARSKIVAKIAGGAYALPYAPQRSPFTLAGDNIRRAREALARADIPLLAENVGGRNGRKIIVDLRTFRVTVAWLDGGAATAGKVEG